MYNTVKANWKHYNALVEVSVDSTVGTIQDPSDTIKDLIIATAIDSISKTTDEYKRTPVTLVEGHARSEKRAG